MVDLLQAAPCGIFSFDTEGIIVQVAPSFCSLVHRKTTELKGHRLDVVFTLSSLVFYQTHFLPLLKQHQRAEEIFLTLKTKEGNEVPVLVTAQQAIDKDKVEFVCTCLPIYHRKQYENEILQTKREAEKALQENTMLIDNKNLLQQNLKELDDKVFQLQQRNEELQQFNAIISHDLQEPLRKLHLFVDLLQSGKSEAAKEMVNKITHLVNKIRNLLLGLQEYVLPENNSLKLAPVELNTVVLMAKQRLQYNYPTAKLDLQLANLPQVEGDVNQLIMLFYHLLENSVKFQSSASLKVIIKGMVLHHNQFKSLKGQYRFTQHVKISYKDNGIGFDPKYQEQIFQLLKKVHPETEGQGVGLTICKKIVTNHMGSIKAEGQEGKGACFTIILPLQHSALQQSEKESLPVFG